MSPNTLQRVFLLHRGSDHYIARKFKCSFVNKFNNGTGTIKTTHFKMNNIPAVDCQCILTVLGDGAVGFETT